MQQIQTILPGVLTGGETAAQPSTPASNSWPNSSEASFDPGDPKTLSRQGKAWAATITKLGALYPNSNYAKMESAQVVATARIWADEMAAVPFEAVSELSRRTFRSERVTKSTFPPNAGDFLVAWNEWDYYAELNADAQAGVTVGPMLPPAVVEKVAEGRNFIAGTIQSRRIATGKGAIFCHCVKRHTTFRGQEIEILVLATLSPDKTRWVCAGADRDRELAWTEPCNFSAPVEESDAATIPGPMPKARPRTWKEIKADAVRGMPALPRGAEEIVETIVDTGPDVALFLLQCGLKIEQQNEEQMGGLREFCYWWADTHPDVPPTPDTWAKRWKEWQSEIGAAAA